MGMSRSWWTTVEWKDKIEQGNKAERKIQRRTCHDELRELSLTPKAVQQLVTHALLMMDRRLYGCAARSCILRRNPSYTPLINFASRCVRTLVFRFTRFFSSVDPGQLIGFGVPHSARLAWTLIPHSLVSLHELLHVSSMKLLGDNVSESARGLQVQK